MGFPQQRPGLRRPLLIPTGANGQQGGALLPTKKEEWDHSAFICGPSLSQVSPSSELYPFPRVRALTGFHPFLSRPLPQYHSPQATSCFWASLTSSLAQGLCISGSSRQEHAFSSTCVPDSFLFLALSSICNSLSPAHPLIPCSSVLFTALATI